MRHASPTPPLIHLPLLLLAVLAFAACGDEPTTGLAVDPRPSLGVGVGPHGIGAPGSVAFHSDRDGNREIYVMNPDGSGVRRVTYRVDAADFYPDLSRNGKWIVFTSTEAGGPGDIQLVSVDGGDPVNLTNTPSVNEDWARWSPEGHRIAFHRGPVGTAELVVLDLETGIETTLTSNTVDDAWPEWSPDGKRLAFRRFQDIHVLDLEHPEHAVRLTDHPALDQMAAWSPSGQQLAFMSFRDGYCSVFLMDADGGEPVNLTPKDPADAAGLWCSRAPSWTRDGRILFMSFRPGTLGTAVYVMSADGSGLTLLADMAGEDGGPTAR